MLWTGVLLTGVTVLLVKWLEAQPSHIIKKILDWFPAILFAYVIPAVTTYIAGWDLADIALHNWSKNIIMPMAIITVMSALSFRQLKVIGIRPILLFMVGSMVVATAPILLLWICKIFFPSTHELIVQTYWQGLIPIVGSWIGGSTSQLVLKEVVGCPDGLFITMLVMDNVLVNIWTLIMFQFIRRSDWWNRRLAIKDEVPDFVPDEIKIKNNQTSILITATICTSLVLVSYSLHLPFLITIILLSIVGLILGNFVPNWNHSFVLKVGGILIVTIMAILGLKLNFSAFSIPPSIIIFSIVWLVMHFLAMVFMAIVLRLHFAWIAIGSMANVGGISTAPAVTAAYNDEWMPYAVVLAILSMVTGTTWGLVTVWLFNLMIL